ncbi:protein CHUP1, chloroplastic-like isoform X1 [Cornus florida]|uniref:protein CHUP1, chloroplastic-like isoform X1 n=2 Tax=Cornus florida TaxID=4283 RepID=UPI0028978633|nr:protein CHUP1, chloroplastic-like isoform X1 [Cornus florida]
MSMREKRDIRPVLLRFGVALALSLGGILYSILRTKPTRPSKSLPPSDCGNQVDSEVGKSGLENDHEQATISYFNTDSIAPEKHDESFLPKVTADSTISSLSPSDRYSGGKDEFLLLEFNEFLNEFDMAAPEAGFSPRKHVETSSSDFEAPKAFKFAESENYEKEIENLRNMVIILRERESTLEAQLLEYYGLKEQETTLMELQNRLKINNVEAKLFTLKIESLQADNRRLEAQVADYAEVMAELETAKAKIKLLNRKLRAETELNKEQILTLQQRVTKLQDQEHEAVASDLDVQLKLQRLKNLEEEAEELRKSNHSLRLENTAVAQKLESTQILPTSVLEDQEAEALKKETHRLRQQNEDLMKEIEQLQADRCGDVEELVYLRWINACLRYELRNYQPGPGETIARDLGKTLSPESEEKAKQLILEYANREGVGEKGINVVDFDSDRWSSFQASYLTDSGEFDDSSVDDSSANRTNTSSKTKLFSKLRRLLRGKDNQHHSRGSSLETTAFIAENSGDSPQCNSAIPAGFVNGTDGHGNRLRTSSSQGLSRYSSDLQRSFELNRSVKDIKDFEHLRRNSDLGSSYVCEIYPSTSDCVVDSDQENQFHQDSETFKRSELLKYAEVLKDSRGTTSKVRKRSMSYS